MKRKSYTTRTAEELGKLLGLSSADTALMKYKAELSSMAVEQIQKSKLSVNEIVARSGVARSKVSAVKNGATVSVSMDLLIKIIVACGGKLKINAA